MTLSPLTKWHTLAAAGALLLTTTTGCSLQTTIGGQTLPSAYYLEDDVQYFPAGPEERLPNQMRAIEAYNLQRAALEDGAPAGPGFAPAPGF